MKIKSVDIEIYREIVEDNVYFKKYGKYDFDIKDNDCIIDIGAHIGIFSIYSALRRNNVKIFAFEPSVDNYKKFIINKMKNQKDILSNGSKILIFNSAISNKTGKEKLYFTDESWGHSLSREKLTKHKEDCVDSKNVNVLSIKDVLKNRKQINYLKIDCEGEEYKIIDLLSQDELRKIEKIVLEYHDSDDANFEKLFNKLINNNFYVIVFGRVENFGMMYAHNKKFEVKK